MCLRFSEGVHIRDRKGAHQTDGEEGHATTEADNSGLAATSQECLQPPEAQEGGGILPERLQREHGPASTLTLDAWPPEM